MATLGGAGAFRLLPMISDTIWGPGFRFMVNTFHNLYERFIQIRGNPKEIALGFALGLFIGFSPTMGIQMALAVFFASILKWNKYSAAIAVWVTNPFSAPFIYGITYLIGAKLTGANHKLHFFGNFDWNMLLMMLQKSPWIIFSLFVGGVFVGLPTALLGYFISYNAVEKYQKSLKGKLKIKKEQLKQKVMKKKQTTKGLARFDGEMPRTAVPQRAQGGVPLTKTDKPDESKTEMPPEEHVL